MMNRAEPYICPLCEAEFKRIQLEAAPETVNAYAHCPACGTALPGREGPTLFKYFLVAEAPDVTPQGRRG
jgi:hypothetical protein